MVHGQTALGHYFFQISQAEREPQVPAHADHDDVGLKLAFRNIDGRRRYMPTRYPTQPSNLQHIPFVTTATNAVDGTAMPGSNPITGT